MLGTAVDVVVRVLIEVVVVLDVDVVVILVLEVVVIVFNCVIAIRCVTIPLPVIKVIRNNKSFNGIKIIKAQ